MAAKRKSKGDKSVRDFRNSKIHHNFNVLETLECGIVLTGTEIKAIRNGQVQLNDAFARIERGNVILYHVHIAEYEFGNMNNHNPYRPRKLLLHKRQIRDLQRQVEAGGKTLVPKRIYFKQALVKVELALCTGKKLYDKREDLKKRDAMREVERAMRRR